MMPGIGFEEMILLVLVAIVVIGPKDLPLMMRKFGRFTGKMRAMAFEFRQGFEELGRQAELEELRKEVADLKKSTGLDDLRKDFEQDKYDLEKDVNAALAAGDPAPAPAPAALDAPEGEAKTAEASAAPAEVAPRPGFGPNGLPLVRSEDKFPRPIRRQPPAAAAAAAPAPYAGLSADHPGYDAGEDFRIDGAAPPAQPAAAPAPAESESDVHVVPDDHVRPAHPAAKNAPAKQDTPA